MKDKYKLWWRYLIYAGVGLVFGIIDYYWEKIQFKLDTGIWEFIVHWAPYLIPVIPIAIIEFKISRLKLWWKQFICCALADALCWVVAIATFYLYQVVEYMFIGKESRIDYHISYRRESWYWSNVLQLIRNEVFLEGIFKWTPIALFGGAIVGLCVALAMELIRKYMKKRKNKTGYAKP